MVLYNNPSSRRRVEYYNRSTGQEYRWSGEQSTKVICLGFTTVEKNSLS
jgi:hypothetical protein